MEKFKGGEYFCKPPYREISGHSRHMHRQGCIFVIERSLPFMRGYEEPVIRDGIKLFIQMNLYYYCLL